jgi:hypothetical protein
MAKVFHLPAYRVRWGTRFEEDDVCVVMESAITDDVALALDYHGWMIVANPEKFLEDPKRKWPMRKSRKGYVPNWADDLDAVT